MHFTSANNRLEQPQLFPFQGLWEQRRCPKLHRGFQFRLSGLMLILRAAVH